MKKAFILIIVFIFQMIGTQLVPNVNDSIPNHGSEDPNEIIGTKGYDALGDTLQWVAAMAPLPYTIYFENDSLLATAWEMKV